MRPLSSLATVALCALLAGCGLTRSRYGGAEIAGDWTYASPGATALAEPFRIEQDQWWRAFGDERLDRVIASVLASNNDLAAAVLAARRVE
jgi:outer membrane protein TolC